MAGGQYGQPKRVAFLEGRASLRPCWHTRLLRVKGFPTACAPWDTHDVPVTMVRVGRAGGGTGRATSGAGAAPVAGLR